MIRHQYDTNNNLREEVIIAPESVNSISSSVRADVTTILKAIKICNAFSLSSIDEFYQAVDTLADFKINYYGDILKPVETLNDSNRFKQLKELLNSTGVNIITYQALVLALVSERLEKARYCFESDEMTVINSVPYLKKLQNGNKPLNEDYNLHSIADRIRHTYINKVPPIILESEKMGTTELLLDLSRQQKTLSDHQESLLGSDHCFNNID